MFVLGFNEFVRNIRKNIMVIIQMAIMYIIIIFVVSAFVEQYRLLKGVENVFDRTGLVCFQISLNSNEFITEEELEKILTKVDGISYAKCSTLYDMEKSLVQDPYFCIYLSTSNPEYVSYIPKIKEGKWCNEQKSQDGIINVVASDNIPYEFEINEVIDYAGYKFRVTGIIDSKEMIYGINNSFSGFDSASYLDLYGNVYQLNQDNEYYAFIASYEDIIREMSCEKIYWGNLVTIDFEDDISESELEQNISRLKERYGYVLNADLFKTKPMYDYSLKLISIKIMPMLMVLLFVSLVVTISMVVSADVNVLYEKKNYGIYFLCGNNWKNTIFFSAVSWSILALISLIISICVCVIICSLNIFNGLALTFTWMHVLAVFVITIIVLGMALIMPYSMLSKLQPIKIFKDNEK